MEQLHAFDCHQNVAEPQATENHIKYTHVYSKSGLVVIYKHAAHRLPLLSAPSALWEYTRSGDASGPVHIAPDCDLHVQNPIPQQIECHSRGGGKW